MVVMGSVGLCWKPELYYQRGPAPRNLQEAWDDVSLREVDDAMFNRQCLIVSSGGGCISSDVQIILRGSRSLGYGFVTFENTDDAEKAVATTDKTEIEGRQVNVEIAKPAPVSQESPAFQPEFGACLLDHFFDRSLRDIELIDFL